MVTESNNRYTLHHIFHISEFERATSVKDFTSVVRDHRRFPREIAILTTKLNIDAAQYSLYRMRKIKESINERASLQPYVTLMHTSSAVLKLAFPRAACKYVKKSLGKDLFQSLGIIPESVDIQLSTSYGVQKKSHMHATAPPRAWNVRKMVRDIANYDKLTCRTNEIIFLSDNYEAMRSKTSVQRLLASVGL